MASGPVDHTVTRHSTKLLTLTGRRRTGPLTGPDCSQPRSVFSYGKCMFDWVATMSKARHTLSPATPSIERFSRLMHQSKEADWCNELFQLGNELGFERTLVALIVKPAKRLEEAFLRSNYAPEWRDTYDRNRLAYCDPTVAHCISRNTSLLWSPDIFSSKEQKQMYEAASAYGLRSGVTLPIHGPKGELGILCFVNDRQPGRPFRHDLDHILPDLSLLRDIVCDTGVGFCTTPDIHIPTPKLTARELECLKGTAAGKTTWEISRILRCSQSVVNFHITNLRDKLGAGSRRDAVVKSLRLGLIDFD